MVVDASLTLLYDNIGVILGLGGAIAAVVAKQVRNHGWNAGKIDSIVKYINEAHDFNINNHDKFVTAVKAVGDISPQFKDTLETHGADIDKLAADSSIGKQKLQQILDEVNNLTDNVALKK